MLTTRVEPLGMKISIRPIGVLLLIYRTIPTPKLQNHHFDLIVTCSPTPVQYRSTQVSVGRCCQVQITPVRSLAVAVRL